MDPKKLKNERVDRVSELVGDGYLTYQIVNICMKEWGVTKRSVERYLTVCYRYLHKQVEEIDKEKILLQYNRLAQKYEKNGNYKMALEYRKQRDKILGIEKQQIEITQTIVQVKRN